MQESLTKPQQETFRILKNRANLASISLLSQAMGSPFEAVRKASLETLIARGGEVEMAAILEKLDLCEDLELALLSPHMSLLLGPIEEGLASSDPVKNQRSLCAIARLAISSEYHHLVRVAESPDDPQQIVAAELLISVASRLGTLARRGINKQESERQDLLGVIASSMRKYHEHRINQVFDAWLCASHWDDQPFKDVFSAGPHDPLAKMVLRQLKISRRREIQELMTGILWSKNASLEAIRLLAESKERAITICLAELTGFLGVTPVLRKNLSCKIPIQALDRVDFSKEILSAAQRNALMQLFLAAEADPDKVLKNANWLLESQSPESEATCSAAIRGLRTLRPEMIVMVLSDCFESPDIEPYAPPPWKADLKRELVRLIHLYPTLPNSVRSSVEFLFSDFLCEELFRHIDDWPEPHLGAYGSLVKIADKAYGPYLERELISQSAAKKIRALRVARYLGVDHSVQALVLPLINDTNEQVRIEAIHTLANSDDRKSAIDAIFPMLRDDDIDVKTAAEMFLSRLQG